MTPIQIEKFRLYLAQHLPAPLFKIACFFRRLWKELNMPEQKKSYGNLNPDKTFYVIRLYPPATGFLANYNYVLGYMHYAYQKGWIPIVDMENYANLYMEEEPINGTRNVWEYFFLQPLDPISNKRYSLDEVYKSKNVILSNGSEQFYDDSNTPETLKWQHEMAELVPFNQIVMTHINKVMAGLTTQHNTTQHNTTQHNTTQHNTTQHNTLGVALRGTDMANRVIGHHIQLTVQEVIPLLKQKIKEWNIETIFVKTEEEKVITILQQELSVPLQYTYANRIRNYKKNQGVVAASNESHYKSLKEYLTTIAILSKCNYLIGSMNNGLYTAILWNNGEYKHLEVIDKGVYK